MVLFSSRARVYNQPLLILRGCSFFPHLASYIFLFTEPLATKITDNVYCIRMNKMTNSQCNPYLNSGVTRDYFVNSVNPVANRKRVQLIVPVITTRSRYLAHQNTFIFIVKTAPLIL